MMTKNAEQALLEWKLISGRIIHARFFSKYVKLLIIQVYAPTKPKDALQPYGPLGPKRLGEVRYVKHLRAYK